jgi:hypothetical protein
MYKNKYSMTHNLLQKSFIFYSRHFNRSNTLEGLSTRCLDKPPNDPKNALALFEIDLTTPIFALFMYDVKSWGRGRGI